MSAHTPEPWHLDGVRWVAAGTSPGQPYIADFNVGSYWRQTGTTQANAARCVACVNACAGMEDPAAEIARLRAQNDKMRAGLERIGAMIELARGILEGGQR